MNRVKSYLMALAVTMVIGGGVVCAGEQTAANEGKGPGLRMDDIIIAAASQFSGGQLPKDAEVVPGVSISGAADGYVVRRYAIVQGEKEVDFFFRVRTLVGNPLRDVAVKFSADGKLIDAFDLNMTKLVSEVGDQAPITPENADKAVQSGNAGAAADVKNAAEGSDKAEAAEAPANVAVQKSEVSGLQQGALPSLVVVYPLLNRNPAQDADSLAALLKGIARAETLIKIDGTFELPPLPKDAFKIENPLPEIGKRLPEFAAKDINGKDVNNQIFRRKPVAVFFTSLDSIACKEMNEIMSKWLENNPKLAGKVVLVLAKPEQEIKAILQNAATQGELVVADPMATVATTFEIEVRPMLLVFNARHRLESVITPDSIRKFSEAMKGIE